jgi:hypothetical protein
MDQPYSVIADWLSKFHTWPETIQALWLIAVPVTVLGVTWIVMRGLRDTVAVWRGGEGRQTDGVCQDAQGSWTVYWHGRDLKELDRTNPPPELVGRGLVVQGPEK